MTFEGILGGKLKESVCDLAAYPGSALQQGSQSPHITYGDSDSNGRDKIRHWAFGAWSVCLRRQSLYTGGFFSRGQRKSRSGQGSRNPRLRARSP